MNYQQYREWERQNEAARTDEEREAEFQAGLEAYFAPIEAANNRFADDLEANWIVDFEGPVLLRRK